MMISCLFAKFSSLFISWLVLLIFFLYTGNWWRQDKTLVSWENMIRQTVTKMFIAFQPPIHPFYPQQKNSTRHDIKILVLGGSGSTVACFLTSCHFFHVSLSKYFPKTVWVTVTAKKYTRQTKSCFFGI